MAFASAFCRGSGGTCFIIAVFEDDHLDPMTAELLYFCPAGYVDVDVVAVHLSGSVFNGKRQHLPVGVVVALQKRAATPNQTSGLQEQSQPRTVFAESE